MMELFQKMNHSIYLRFVILLFHYEYCVELQTFFCAWISIRPFHLYLIRKQYSSTMNKVQFAPHRSAPFSVPARIYIRAFSLNFIKLFYTLFLPEIGIV